ncbi:MAG: hypothetical protein RIQ52_568 [Pseudomonadota bacterium]
MDMMAVLASWHEEMTVIRRDLHANPELSFDEYQTAEKVAARLESWGLEVQRGLGGTGVVGILKKGSSQHAIGLRADMDALPMQEMNTFAHASQHDGKMHACGHDGHTAMLLCAARYLASHADFDGTVYFVFQPAEEFGAGARQMMEDGLLTRFPMQAIFGLHNWPALEEGSFGVTSGPIMASSNQFHVAIRGRGAHGAMPHEGVDPVMAAVQIAQMFQTIITQNRDPLEAAVISVTQIHAGTADNVIPEDAILRGTVRTFSLEALDLVETRMREIVEMAAAAMGCSGELTFTRNYPPTINHETATAFCAGVMQALVGESRVNARVRPTMGAEDFAFYLQAIPGCYVWLGNGSGDHRLPGHGEAPCLLHNGAYDFNDAILPLGAAYWITLVQHWFTNPHQNSAWRL